MPSTSLEERIASLEGFYRELTKRIDDLRSEMNNQMSDLRTEVRTSSRWTISLILMNWLSILAAIFLVVGRR